MSFSATSPIADELRRLHHDLRNCLGVIAMGTQLLPAIRDDGNTFDEVLDSVEQECITATKLLEEFFRTACTQSD